MSLLCCTCSGYGGWFVVSVEFICFLDIFLVKGSYIYVALIKQDSPEVHANAAEILSAVTRCAPPALAAKICSPRFVEFISVLLTIGSEIAEKELINQSVIKHCIDLFFL